MRYPSRIEFFSSGLACTLVFCAMGQVQAYELYADEDSRLNADLLAVFGHFNSRKNYDGTPAGLPGGKVSSSMA